MELYHSGHAWRRQCLGRDDRGSGDASARRSSAPVFQSRLHLCHYCIETGNGESPILSPPPLGRRQTSFAGSRVRRFRWAMIVAIAAAREIEQQKFTKTQDFPACAIRSNCRWFAQEGTVACSICPQVVYDMNDEKQAKGLMDKFQFSSAFGVLREVVAVHSVA